MDLRSVTSSDDLRHGPSLRGVHIDETDGSESQASTLLSELRCSRKKKREESLPHGTVEVSDISLMDDFEEMEKLAKSSSFSDTHFSEISAFLKALEIQSQDNTSKASNCEMVSLDYKADICHLGPIELPNARKNVPYFGSADSMHNSCDALRPPGISPKVCSFCESNLNLSSKQLKQHQLQPGLSKSISKLIELIGGVYQPQSLVHNMRNLSENNGNTLLNNSVASSGYTVRVFQWKSSELDHLLRHFVNTCTEVLNENVDLGTFFAELQSTLDWIINHCFSVKDVSSIRDAIKNQFKWDDALSDGELEDAINYPCSEAESKEPSDEMTLQFQSSTALNGWDDLLGSKEIQLNPKEENRRLKEKIRNMESVQQDLERKLHSGTKKIEDLMTHLRELEENMCCLQMELKASEESKGLIEDQLQKFKLRNKDQESMLRDLRGELNEPHQKLSSFEVETQRKICCFNKLEAACLQQHLVMDSVRKNGGMEFVEDGRQLQMEFDITAATEKLAECQETLLILGKQLKELDSPKEPNLFDEVVSTITAAIPGGTNARHRHSSSSLLYHIRAEDNCTPEDAESPKTKEVICTNVPCSHAPLGSIKSPERSIHSSTWKTKGETSSRAAVTVNSKKCGGGVSLMRMLQLGSKRESGKKSLTMVEQV
ncbi:hypothetical protein Syun_015266 [Stephania yunnanensis]|uniref:Filament-like plant protein 7 n=1 Tax=Stephania yunnanensis TaxID=152371 RepID=A0AAP0JKU2_9MAGN